MKGFLSILIIALIAVIDSGTADEQKNLQKLVDDCKGEAGLPADAKLDNMEDAKVKCFYHCIFKKIGKVGPDGKLSIDKVIAIYEKHHPNLSENIKTMFKQCVEIANKNNDCEVSTSFIKCLNEKAKKQGAPPPTD